MAGWQLVGEIIEHPNCSPQTMRDIYQSSPSMAEKIATQPHCPPDLLDQLASSPRIAVRAYVAGNPSSPDTALQHLSRSAADEILLSLAGNPSCPSSILENLLKSHHPSTVRAAADNPNLPRTTLAMWQLSR
jgi:hypothetical protein